MPALALRIALPFLAAVTVFAGPAVSLPVGEPDSPQSGYADEIALALEVGTVLEAERLDLTTLMVELGLHANPGSDAGFGARIHRFRIRRGAAELRLHVMTATDEHGAPVVARLRCDFGLPHGRTEDQRSAFCEAVLPSWPGTRGKGRNGLVLLTHWKDPSVLVELERTKARALGPLPPVDVPPSLREDLEVLTSGFHALTFGSGCGIAGIPPYGRPETSRLLEAGRFDLLRVALRGWDPVGRAYAAEALLTHDRADILDHAAIRALRDQVIPVCDGCSGGRATVGEVLDERLRR